MRYSLDEKFKGTIHEVGVDAKMGEILEDRIEGPDADQLDGDA